MLHWPSVITVPCAASNTAIASNDAHADQCETAAHLSHVVDDLQQHCLGVDVGVGVVLLHVAHEPHQLADGLDAQLRALLCGLLCAHED